MRFSRAFQIIPLTFLSVSCGVSDSSHQGDSNSAAQGSSEEALRNGPPPTQAPATCLAAWNKYVEANPVGLYEEREIEIETKSGSMKYMTKTLQKTTILESSAEQVKVALVVDDVFPVLVPRSVNTTKMVLKDDFLRGCDGENPVSVTPIPENPLPHAKVLDSKLLKIKVGAGTFNCEYRKTQAEIVSISNTTVAETWIAQIDGRLSEVKSVSVSSTKNHGEVQMLTRKSELLKRTF